MDDRLPCTGTENFTAHGLDRELRDIRQTMKTMDERIFNELSELRSEIANIRVIAAHNDSQDERYQELRSEVVSIGNQVQSNKSFSDRMMGGFAVVMAIVAILQIGPWIVPPPIREPVPVMENWPNAN